jgi:site-specific DNA-methyltransferase (adenine-specific)
VGSGTTMKVARKLNRNSIGVEIDKSLIPIIKQKISSNNSFEKSEDNFVIIKRK